MSYIGLLDCNNFFVSCERLFRPDLEGKPVVILSSNDGCIISRSNEAKALGIQMGAPYFQVRDELKKNDVVVFSGNITLYRDISSRVMNTLASCGVRFEPYSIDEAFFILEDGEATPEYLHAIRERVRTWTGIPVSIGAGKSMVIAKYASEKAKKGRGVHIIHPGDAWGEEMKNIHVGELWGVGRSSTATLLKNGIQSAYVITKTDTARLRELLGISGVRLRESLEGNGHVELSSHADQQSIMSSRSFGETTTSKHVLFEALSYHIEHAARKMRREGMAALRMSVQIRPRRHGTYMLRGGYDEVVFDVPTRDTRVFLRHAKASLDRLYEKGVPYGKAGVMLGGFVPLDRVTGSLFSEPHERARSSKLMETIDALAAKYGPSGALRFGFTPRRSTTTSRASFRSKEYTTSWSEIPHVLAKNKGHDR